MEETYKGYKITYDEFSQCFVFKIEDAIPLRVYTVGQARETIDNFLRDKALVRKKVIGFSSLDGSRIVATITNVVFDEPQRVHSSAITLWFYEGKERLPTLGPFLEFNTKNRLLADKYIQAKKEEEQARKKAEQIWKEEISPLFIKLEKT